MRYFQKYGGLKGIIILDKRTGISYLEADNASLEYVDKNPTQYKKTSENSQVESYEINSDPNNTTFLRDDNDPVYNNEKIFIISEKTRQILMKDHEEDFVIVIPYFDAQTILRTNGETTIPIGVKLPYLENTELINKNYLYFEALKRTKSKNLTPENTLQYASNINQVNKSLTCPYSLNDVLTKNGRTTMEIDEKCPSLAINDGLFIYFVPRDRKSVV